MLGTRQTILTSLPARSRTTPPASAGIDSGRVRPAESPLTLHVASALAADDVDHVEQRGGDRVAVTSPADQRVVADVGVISHQLIDGLAPRHLPQWSTAARRPRTSATGHHLAAGAGSGSVVLVGSLWGALGDALDQSGTDRVELGELAEVSGDALGDLDCGQLRPGRASRPGAVAARRRR